MKIIFEVSGGVTGVELCGRFDDADLPDDLAKKLSAAIQDGSLKSCENNPSNPLAADEQLYRLAIKEFEGNEKTYKFMFNETQAESEVLDLMDEMTILLKKQLLNKRKMQD